MNSRQMKLNIQYTTPDEALNKKEVSSPRVKALFCHTLEDSLSCSFESISNEDYCEGNRKVPYKLNIFGSKKAGIPSPVQILQYNQLEISKENSLSRSSSKTKRNQLSSLGESGSQLTNIKKGMVL